MENVEDSLRPTEALALVAAARTRTVNRLAYSTPFRWLTAAYAGALIGSIVLIPLEGVSAMIPVAAGLALQAWHDRRAGITDWGFRQKAARPWAFALLVLMVVALGATKIAAHYSGWWAIAVCLAVIPAVAWIIDRGQDAVLRDVTRTS